MKGISFSKNSYVRAERVTEIGKEDELFQKELIKGGGMSLLRKISFYSCDHIPLSSSSFQNNFSANDDLYSHNHINHDSGAM